MDTRPATGQAGEFTGRHMLLIMLAFFGVIIAVNVAMAMFATSSWTGFVVRNSYVASQEFNEKAAQGRAQAALGWSGTLAVDRGAIRYRLVDRAGDPVALAAVNVIFRRPTSDAEDRSFALGRAGQGWHSAEGTMRDGVWIVEVDSEAGLEAPYRDVRRIRLRGGALE